MKFYFTIFFATLCFSNPIYSQLESAKEVLLLMGTRFEITAMADSKDLAKAAVDEGINEIKRIEELISSWKYGSQTSQLNRSAGITPVEVDKELFDIIVRSLKIAEWTNGAFDISFASMDRLYTFDKKEYKLPSEEDRLAAIKKVDFKNIILNRKKQSVFLSYAGMKIGFGGIGKGYAANQAKKVMENIAGVKGGVINAAGDLLAWGDNNRKDGWPIQISDPKDISKTLGWLNIENMSVVTSGDYEKYFISDGKRYAHIINPKTGLPTTGVKSATVICPDAELGDAIATSLFIMGGKEAIAFINTLSNFEALIITDADHVLTSKNLKLKTY